MYFISVRLSHLPSIQIRAASIIKECVAAASKQMTTNMDDTKYSLYSLLHAMPLLAGYMGGGHNNRYICLQDPPHVRVGT
jgi:hypothetical protein